MLPEKESYIEMDFNYGILSKILMKDHSIDIKAKAIYALLCVYAGSTRTAFPGRDIILHDLNISKDTYHKHMKSLKEAGYIRISKIKHPTGQFQSNVYTLSPCPNSSDTEKPDTVNSDTKSNSLKINKLKKDIYPKVVDKPVDSVHKSTEYRLATLLAELIAKNYDKPTAPNKHVIKWATDIEMIHRLDGATWEQIKFVIAWSQQHSFWHRNIKSGFKLRAQFETLKDAIKDEDNDKRNKDKMQQRGPKISNKIPQQIRNIENVERASPDSEAVKHFHKIREELLSKKKL